MKNLNLQSDLKKFHFKIVIFLYFLPISTFENRAKNFENNFFLFTTCNMQQYDTVVCFLATKVSGKISCSSVGVFLSILAHLAHLASAFFIESRINGLIFGYVSEHASTKKHVSEHCCSSVWVFSSILAQSFLISTGIKRQMF